MDEDLWMRLLYLSLLLLAVGGWVFVEFRQRLGQSLRLAAAWGLIFLGVIAGYGLWNDVSPDLMPRQAVVEGGAIEIPRGPDGHFHLTLEINGTPVRFVADTGATNMVLTRADAARLGIDQTTDAEGGFNAAGTAGRPPAGCTLDREPLEGVAKRSGNLSTSACMDTQGRVACG